VPLPQIPIDDPRVLALAKARQQFAHECTFLPTWEELTDEEREGSLPDARNYLESAINAGLVPAVELIDSGWRASLTNLNDEIDWQITAMATAAADLPLLLYRFRTAPAGRHEGRNRAEQARRDRRARQRVHPRVRRGRRRYLPPHHEPHQRTRGGSTSRPARPSASKRASHDTRRPSGSLS
jgi:hypothetical protein